MNKQHENKLKEMHQLRLKANEEVKHLTEAISMQQVQINNLQLETKKYEAQLQFLTTERDIILQAQMHANPEKYTPKV
jgi:hypothetical protein